jgi:hypothetical protein
MTTFQDDDHSYASRKEGSWVTHEVADRAELEIRCSCPECFEDARDYAYEENERRDMRAVLSESARA